MLTLFEEHGQLCCRMPQFPREWIQVTHFQQEYSAPSEAVVHSHGDVVVSVCPITDGNFHHLVKLVSVRFLYNKGSGFFGFVLF